jgi:hypothetical protein
MICMDLRYRLFSLVCAGVGSDDKTLVDWDATT